MWVKTVGWLVLSGAMAGTVVTTTEAESGEYGGLVAGSEREERVETESGDEAGGSAWTVAVVAAGTTVGLCAFAVALGLFLGSRDKAKAGASGGGLGSSLRSFTASIGSTLSSLRPPNTSRPSVPCPGEAKQDGEEEEEEMVSINLGSEDGDETYEYDGPELGPYFLPATPRPSTPHLTPSYLSTPRPTTTKTTAPSSPYTISSTPCSI